VRHLGSLLLAVLTAPLALLLALRGLGAFLDAAEARPPDPLATATAISALGLAGLLLAFLVLPRFSPLGPALAGAGYLAVGLWGLANLGHLRAQVPPEVMVGLDDRAIAVTAAVSPLLAMPLLVTLFSARRWQGRPRAAPAPAVQPPPGYPPPGYPPPYAHPPHGYGQPVILRPVEMTREFPAVPAPQQATEPAREWPTEPIPTSTPGSGDSTSGESTPEPDRTEEGPATGADRTDTGRGDADTATGERPEPSPSDASQRQEPVSRD
jgi:hypothetical protein